MSGAPNNYAWRGTQKSGTAADELASSVFAVDSVLNSVSTATLVKVSAVSVNAGATGAVGSVDVVPLVNAIDGYGQATPHGTVYKLAYIRYHGGDNAVIIDPQPGDVGLAVFADRDISSVKSTGKQANPGSRRRWSMSDGIYVGKCVGGSDPKQWIRMTTDTVEIANKSGNKILMDENGVTITVVAGGTLRVTSDVIAGYGTSNPITVQTHVHPDPQGGTTGLPEE